MAGSVNKVILIGNLGADPDIRVAQNGNKVAMLSVATSEKWRDRDTGEPRERTEWHRVVCWNEGLVGVIEQYARKGGKVYVEGELQTRKWQDQSGQDRYTTEVVLTGFRARFELLGSNRISDQIGNASRPGNASYAEQSGGTVGHAGSQNATSGASNSLIDEQAGIPFDDEIPFGPEWR